VRSHPVFAVFVPWSESASPSSCFKHTLGRRDTTSPRTPRNYFLSLVSHPSGLSVFHTFVSYNGVVVGKQCDAGNLVQWKNVCFSLRSSQWHQVFGLTEKGRYGVIFDAGSSVRNSNRKTPPPIEDTYNRSKGTRVHVYRWLDAVSARDKASKGELHSLPKLETKKKWTKKVKPGTLPTSTSRLQQTEPVVQGYQRLAISPSLSAKTT